MSLFKTKTTQPAAAPAANKTAPTTSMSKKTSIFGGITKPKAAYVKNFFTPGDYVLALKKIIVKISDHPDHRNEPMGVAVFDVLESNPPAVESPDRPQPVGAEVSMTKYFAGKSADFALRDWRNLCCALMDEDEQAIDWQNLTEEEVAAFEAACDDLGENPEPYYGKKVRCSVVEKVLAATESKPEKRVTNTFFGIYEE